jgi:hypothetical protein
VDLTGHEGGLAIPVQQAVRSLEVRHPRVVARGPPVTKAAAGTEGPTMKLPCNLALLAACVWLGCGGEPGLPPGAPDPGRGEPDPRPVPADVAGCAGSVLYANPAEGDERGPWPVGVRTVDLDGLVTEVWYPAVRDSHVDVRRVLYDVRDWLPPGEATKIPNDANAWQICDCYRGLPVDAERGPYPLLLFIHGTAGFRIQSLAFMVHWASRGFIVVAADHPSLYLGDLLADPIGNFGRADLPGDARRMIAALLTDDSALGAGLDARLDAARVGMSGHSAGGGGIAGLGDIAQVLMPMASGGVQEGPALASAFVLAAIDDAVVPVSRTLEGYDDSPAPKRFLGIANAGHLVFSDICAIRNAEGQSILDIALEYQIDNASLASLLFDGCEPHQIDPALGWQITHHVTSPVWEETLHCRAGAADGLSDVGSRFPLAEDYREEL